MLALPGYEIQEQLHHGRRSDVFRATRLATHEPVVLKVSVGDASPAESLLRARHELEIAASIASANVIHYQGVESADGRAVLVVDAFVGRSLADLLAGGPLAVEAAVQIGLEVASGLVEIHAHGVIHRGIHPGNMLVDPSTWELKIVDFADASVLRHSAVPTLRADGLAMPLAYMSPEQTGRMNRQIDHRSDFYSLGATLYHAIVGRPPFEAKDPLALLHAQIARAHLPLCEVDPRVPRQLSHLVDRLLAKNAEDRYQSARGIVADLAECLRQLRATGDIRAFRLGAEDIAETFAIPDKLYGRAAERAELMNAFAAAASGGKLMLVVSGEPGIGKSALVREVHKPITARRAFFVQGKFDQHMRHVPYAALAQALRELCYELLATSAAKLAGWRARIRGVLGANAALAVDVVPDLERIIGPQPPVPPTGLLEAQHRLDVTLVRLVSAFASETHPLVVFLDDLQWADPATLHALEVLLTAPEATHVLVIGAYRGNEVDANHPLSLALDRLRAAAADVRSIELRGLSEADVRALAADTLHATPAAVAELSRLIADKTAGNPLFVDELLRTLHAEELIKFSPEVRAWTWQLAEIESVAITENVVDLLVSKLAALPSETQEAVQLAACLGNRFGLVALAACAGISAPAMRARLAPAILQRLVVPLDPSYPLEASADESEPAVDYRYRFLHDRVQQAAYQRIPSGERVATHLRIGRVLRAITVLDANPGAIFDIVDQLGVGLAAIDDPRERIAVAALHLDAGNRARQTAAYEDALAYLRAGISLLPAEMWDVHYRLAVDLHFGFAESAYLAAHFDEADTCSDALLPRLRTNCEKADLYTVRIALEANRGRYDRALAHGREALAMLGLPIPVTPEALAAATAAAAGAIPREPAEIARLERLPEATDSNAVAIAKILARIAAPAYFSDPALSAWIVYTNIARMIEHGITAASAAAVSDFTLVCVAVREYERGLAFGELGMRLLERPDAVPLRTHSAVVFALSANCHSRNHLRTSIPILERAISIGLETGAVLYTCYAAASLPELRFMVGDAIDDVLREAELRDHTTRRFRYDEMTFVLRAFRHQLRRLRGDPQDDADGLVAIAQSSSPVVRGAYYSFEVVTRSLFGETRPGVIAILTEDESIRYSSSGLVRLTAYAFHACLLLIDGLRDPALPHAAIEAMLAQKVELLERLAVSAPTNFRHQHTLVRAELADREGRLDDAISLYEDAMRDAEDHGYLQNAALAAERAGLAFTRRGHARIARIFLAQARAGYAKWGAAGKVRALDAAHPGLAPRELTKDEAGPTIDMLGVQRAARAMSSVIELPALLEQMLRVIVQISGAQRASLISVHADKLRLEARFDGEADALDALTGAAVELDTLVSESIVAHALRSGDDVVLPDAAREGAFTLDPYVVRHNAKSILAMPVRLRDRVTGVLFLENELAANAFPLDRLAALRVVLAHAASSLENERLYEALAASEARLREFLEHLPVGVYIVDPFGRAILMNRAAQQLLGKELDPSVRAAETPEFFRLFIAGTDQPYPPERGALARALAGERTMADDLEVRRPDRTVQLAVWGSPIRDEAGNVRFAMAAFQDISQQRAAEASRLRLEEQLRQAERLDSIGRLAGGVAHDFNNLLTPILACSELAARTLPRDSSAYDHLQAIHEAAERAAELTRHLLAFGRRQVLDRRVIDLNAGMREFEHLLRRLIPENIELELRLAPALASVRADALQIQRIVTNLALNAADAMRDGGTLTIETANETTEELGPCVVLRVTDTGHGIDKDTLPKIFEPFFTTKGLRGGTGLGLPTVYGLVSAHEGIVRVHSEVGRGTTFEVFLPRVAAPAEPVASPIAAVARPGHGESILVVDDDEAVRRVICDILRDLGYDVVVAADAVEAQQIVQGRSAPFDLLISDVVMPGMNGRELWVALRRLQPGLPALFVSGYSDDVLSVHGALDPGIELVHKPISIEVLRLRVRALLDARRAASGLSE